jgi:hypothetical protein
MGGSAHLNKYTRQEQISLVADVQLGHKSCGVLLGDAAARLGKNEEGWAEGRAWLVTWIITKIERVERVR